MEISVINMYHDGAYYVVTFKYWEKGECACSAVKLKKVFENEPTVQDLINSI